jgi:BirA family transcriptional regulator, biotin operon repressor / biotin---[acetyl-CoA-carboxylase] ligase
MFRSKAQSPIAKAWTSQLQDQIDRLESCCVERAVVLDSTPSTMDAAAQIAAQTDVQGAAGVVVVALNQTHGRGQRGRRWVDAPGHSLACTFAIGAETIGAPGVDPCLRSAAVGCAVHETIAQRAPASCRVMIKWPNDIVVRDRDVDAGFRERKIAGILIEHQTQRADGCALIGIGINCTQAPSDWPPELKGSATSLSEIEAPADRLELMGSLIRRLSAWSSCLADLEKTRAQIQTHYQDNNAMVGTRRAFQYDNDRYEGLVEAIDPLGSIVVRCASGLHRLPIAQTTHLRADA